MSIRVCVTDDAIPRNPAYACKGLTSELQRLEVDCEGIIRHPQGLGEQTDMSRKEKGINPVKIPLLSYGWDSYRSRGRSCELEVLLANEITESDQHCP